MSFRGRPTISPADFSRFNAESCVVIAVRPSVRGQSIVDYAFSSILAGGDRLVMLHVLNSIPSMPPLPCEYLFNPSLYFRRQRQ